ncbi:MAG: phosphopantetheine-binding protein [Pseudohongiellaceae bacterium]
MEIQTQQTEHITATIRQTLNDLDIEIHPESQTPLTEMAPDSLSLLELLIELEDALEIILDPADIKANAKFEDLVTLCATAIAAKTEREAA